MRYFNQALTTADFTRIEENLTAKRFLELCPDEDSTLNTNPLFIEFALVKEDDPLAEQKPVEDFQGYAPEASLDFERFNLEAGRDFANLFPRLTVWDIKFDDLWKELDELPSSEAKHLLVLLIKSRYLAYKYNLESKEGFLGENRNAGKLRATVATYYDTALQINCETLLPIKD